MNSDQLSSLVIERNLLKQLISLDKARYNYLELRVAEIKIIINSAYKVLPENKFSIFEPDQALMITKEGNNYMVELLNKTEESTL